MQFTNVELSRLDHHPNQPRHKMEGVEELADSIAARGIIVPPIVVADGDRYIIVDGHRRVAAARLAKLTEIPVNVAEDWTEASMLEDAMAANMQRDAMTALDVSQGLQLLLTLGVDRERVSKITGRSEAEIAFAQTIAKAPKKAAKAAAVQASLEEAAALVEFDGYPNATEALTGSIGTAMFAQNLAKHRMQRDNDIRRDAAMRKLDAAGVPVLKDQDTWSGRTRRLEHLVPKITPAEHASCPGHAGHVTAEGKVSYWCTTPGVHNSRGGGAKTEEQITEDRAKRASRAGFKACRVVRHEYACRLIRGVEGNRGHKNEALVFLAGYARAHGLPNRLDDLFGEFIVMQATPIQTLLALAIAQQEKAIDGHVKFNAGFGMRNDVEGPYYGLLKLAGYELAECEAAILKKDAKPARVAPSSPTFNTSRMLGEAGDVRTIHAMIAGRDPVVVANVDCTSVVSPESHIVMWQTRYCEAGYPDQAAWSDVCRDKGWNSDCIAVRLLEAATPAEAPALCPDCKGTCQMPDKTGGGNHRCKTCKGTGLATVVMCGQTWGCENNWGGACKKGVPCNSWQDPAKATAADPQTESTEEVTA
jgi:ParB/RepB/Spo0J family partition protein